mmetsp:Transcript_4823/g.7039  ORF Transcript_4823/g.7039 Transcript_4823/m.7039 type:complete len:272 (-) Transcript_4823:826-1641(-)
MFSTRMIIFGFILLSTTLSIATSSERFLAQKNDNGHCIFTQNTGNTGNELFCLTVVIDIKGVRFDDVCTKRRITLLEQALLEYHNAAIDCACPRNKVTYEDIQILSGDIRTVSGDPGDIDWCKRKNHGKSTRRALLGSEEKDMDTRKLPIDRPVTRIPYTVSGPCGRQCPITPFPGSDCIDCGSMEGESVEFRRLANGVDSECFEPLFTSILNDNGFDGVTSVEIMRGSVEDQSVCDVIRAYTIPQIPKNSKASKGTKSSKGTKGSKSSSY